MNDHSGGRLRDDLHATVMQENEFLWLCLCYYCNADASLSEGKNALFSVIAKGQVHPLSLLNFSFTARFRGGLRHAAESLSLNRVTPSPGNRRQQQRRSVAWKSSLGLFNLSKFDPKTFAGVGTDNNVVIYGGGIGVSR